MMGPSLARVAAVDGHAIVLRGVEAVLEGASGVRHVRSASSVAELLRDGVEDIDVVLLDVDLGDGSDAAENVRVLRDLGVQVLLHAGARRPATLRRALAAGACALVLKDDSPEHLVCALAAAARGEAHVNSELAEAVLADPVGAVELSPRAREVVRLLAAGYPWSSVASTLGISVSTARTHMMHVMNAFEAAGVPLRDGPREAVARALNAGHIDDPYPRRPWIDPEASEG